MRRLLIACLLLCGCGDGTEPDRPPRAEFLWPAPERYEVDARWAGGRLSGTMRLTLRNTGPLALREVWLRTWPNAFGSCRRPLATLMPSAGTREGCTAHRIALEPALDRGDTRAVEVEFSVRVPRRDDRFGHFNGVAYLGNALPTLAVADEDGWRLPPYFGRGEAWFTLAADWHVRLDLPDGLTVAATGTETSPGVHEAKRARDFMIVIGRLRATEIRVGDITVRHFRLPRQPKAIAKRPLSVARISLREYQRWYGPYGRQELDLVEGPGSAGTDGVAMEYPELVLTPAAGRVVAHEVAHQWWAFIMGNDPYREPFLDEGFADYSATRLPHSVTGPDELRGCPRPKRPPRPPVDSGVPTLERAGGRAYVRTAYTGGACLLYRMERALGRERFDAMLRALVAEHRDRTWTGADLFAAFERAAPDGLDAGEFLGREGVSRD